MNRRALSFLLALVMLFSLAAPAYASDAQPEEPNAAEELQDNAPVGDIVAEEIEEEAPPEEGSVPAEAGGEAAAAEEEASPAEAPTPDAAEEEAVPAEAPAPDAAEEEASPAKAPAPEECEEESLPAKAPASEEEAGEDVPLRSGEQITITLKANGGTFSWLTNPGDEYEMLLNPGDVFYGANYRPEHADAHKVFSGWYSEPSGGTLVCSPEDSFAPEADMTLYAAWGDAFLVCFDANGGFFDLAGSTTQTVTAPAGSSVYGPDAPTHPVSGTTFTGWYSDENSTQLFILPGGSFEPTADITLYAGWCDASGYTVTFHANGGYFTAPGDETAEIVVQPDWFVSWDDCPVYHENAHMVFTGWYRDPACTELAFDRYSSLQPEGDVDLYAGWELGVIVTFNANGGCFYGNETLVTIQHTYCADDDGVYFNDSMGALCVSSAAAFDGWYFDDACTLPVADLYTFFVPSEDVTIYAKWIQLCKVTFNGNGGWFYEDENRVSVDVYTTPGDIMGDSSSWPRPVKADLHEAFAGWQEANGSPVDLSSYAPTEDSSLYADWGEGWVVTFDGNGADILGQPNTPTLQVSVLKGHTIRENNLWASSEGGSILSSGWFLTADCSGEEVDLKSFVPTADTTLYARLGRRFAYTLNANGGHFIWGGPQDEVFTNYYWEYKSYEAPKDLIGPQDNLAFLGWFSDQACGTLVYRPGESFSPSADMTLYAGWAEGNVVTLDANGGYFFGDQTQTTLKCAVLPDKPLNCSYEPSLPTGQLRFAGWYRDRELTQKVDPVNFYPTCDITLYAKWANFHLIRLLANGGHFQGDFPSSEERLNVEQGCAFVASEMPIPVSADPLKSFSGWYAESACITLVCAANASFVPSGGTILYAGYSSAVTVTFDANGGFFSSDDGNVVIKQESFRPNQDSVMCLDPRGAQHADPGAHFEGWYLDTALTQPVSQGYTPYYPTEDLTLYAKWVIWPKLTFIANGGFFNEDETQTSYFAYTTPGDIIGLRPEPTKSDLRQDFAGWVDENGNAVNVYAYIPDGDSTLYATWGEGWIITFNGNGAFIAGDPEKPTLAVSVLKGGTIDEDPLVYCDDFSLCGSGWFLTPDCSGQEIDPWSCVPTQDMTLYARLARRFTVTYDANGGHFGEYSTWTTQTRDYWEFSSGTPMVDVYGAQADLAFTGWYSDQNCTQLVCAPGESFTPTASVTLYAGWTRGNVVSFDANGGYFQGGQHAATATRAVIPGCTIDLAPTPIREDRTLLFAGWCTDAACTQQIDIEEFVPSGDVTLYARYAHFYSIKFLGNGGCFPGYHGRIDWYANAEENSALDVSAVPVPTYAGTGRVFTGWYAEPACVTLVCPAGGSFVPTDHLTLYAGWDMIPLPVITIQPANVSAVAGKTATFTVTATGADSYQWQYRKTANGSWANSPASGNATPTLKVAASAAKNGYQYRCIVSNAAGSVTSSVATLSVTQGVPVITAQPSNVSILPGKTATFTATATGADSYQWQYRKSASGTWTKTSATGNATPTLKVAVTEAKNGYQYRCIISNAAGSVTSSVATLTVIAKPVITAQPMNVTAAPGKTATFTVTATGADSYQWQYRKSASGTWAKTSAAGNATAALKVAVTAAKNGYQYRCKVSNASGSVYSSVVTLTVAAKPTITTQPQNVTAVAGKTATFTVAADGADSYQWQYRKSASGTWAKTSAVGNATAALKVSVTAAKNGYQYRCKVSNAAGSVYSNVVTLTVK